MCRTVCAHKSVFVFLHLVGLHEYFVWISILRESCGFFAKLERVVCCADHILFYFARVNSYS